jgi:hypothetical protein
MSNWYALTSCLDINVLNQVVIQFVKGLEPYLLSEEQNTKIYNNRITSNNQDKTFGFLTAVADFTSCITAH